MNRLKRGCERVFSQAANWAFHHNRIALALVVAVFLSLVTQLPQLRVDTSNESFFRPDDPVLLDYNEFRNQFGKDEFIVIAISCDTVFDFEVLEQLRQLHRALEESVPFVDEITSLLNVRNTRGEGDELIVEDFLASWPQTEEQLASLQQRASENSLYENFIINREGTVTTIIIKPFACNPDQVDQLQEEGSCQPMSNVQNRRLISAIMPLLDRYDAPGFSIAISGMPVVIESLNLTLEHDLAIIVPIIFLMVIVFLGLLFRRISGIVYPVLVFILSLLSAIGMMAALHIPMTNITSILPSFILVVGISDAVHILALFYPRYQQSHDRREAMVWAMGHAGLPVLMTSLTTAGGMLSFVATEIAPIADLGMIIPLSVALALFYTVLLLPALVAIFPVRLRPLHDSKGKRLDQCLTKIAQLTCSRQRLVIAVFAALLVVALIGASKLRFEHNALKWFSNDSPVRLATEKIDRQMRGTVSFDVVIDTGRADGLYDIAFLTALEAAVHALGSYEDGDLFVGKILALTTVLKETNRALHANRQEAYTIPTSRELVAQELFLFQMSGSDDLEDFVDNQFSKTRFTMHLPYRDTSKYKKFVTAIEDELKPRFPSCSITVTGVNALFVEILNNVMSTMARSYTIALLLISFLMIGMLGKLRMGLLSMIPNLFPIIMILGVMGWLGIPLDFGTVLIGSITIGLVVDDTIHFLHNFGTYYDRCKDPTRATIETMITVGRAMIVTSLVLSGGFLCDLFSELTLNKYFGFLIALTILIALITDFLLAPALLSLVYKRKHSPNDAQEKSP